MLILFNFCQNKLHTAVNVCLKKDNKKNRVNQVIQVYLLKNSVINRKKTRGVTNSNKTTEKVL